MNAVLHMNGRRLAVEREVEAAQKRRACVDQVVKGRVSAKRVHELVFDKGRDEFTTAQRQQVRELVRKREGLSS